MLNAVEARSYRTSAELTRKNAFSGAPFAPRGDSGGSSIPSELVSESQIAKSL
jgi:hypothetical protein